jgi:hypothetical protein
MRVRKAEGLHPGEVRVGGPGGLEPGVGLRDDHDRSAPAAHGQSERFSNPRQIGRGPLRVRRVHFRRASEVVVAVDHVEGDEQDITVGSAHVLSELGVPGVFTLTRQPHGAPAEALIAREEHLAELRQSLERVVRARLCPAAFTPNALSGGVSIRVEIRSGSSGPPCRYPVETDNNRGPVSFQLMNVHSRIALAWSKYM